MKEPMFYANPLIEKPFNLI